jgi:hypothetical protein
LKFQKNWAEDIESEISKKYHLLNEIPRLQKVLIPNLNTVKNNFVKVESESIHGTTSQVKFNHCTATSREVGDVLLSVMLVDDQDLIFHKITFVQAKKKSLFDWKPSQSEGEQLYFLSRFPKFKGVKGIFPKTEIILPNYSGCLGSYFFIYPEIGFEFSSAKIVDLYVNNKGCSCIISHSSYKYASWGNAFFKNVLYCPNPFDFIRNLTQFNIGEIIHSELGFLKVNNEAKDLFKSILMKLKDKDNSFYKIAKKEYGEDFKSSSEPNNDDVDFLLINILIDTSRFEVSEY